MACPRQTFCLIKSLKISHTSKPHPAHVHEDHQIPRELYYIIFCTVYIIYFRLVVYIVTCTVYKLKRGGVCVLYPTIRIWQKSRSLPAPSIMCIWREFWRSDALVRVFRKDYRLKAHAELLLTNSPPLTQMPFYVPSVIKYRSIL